VTGLLRAYKGKNETMYLEVEKFNSYERDIRKLEGSEGATFNGQYTKTFNLKMVMFNLPNYFTVKKNKKDLKVGFKKEILKSRNPFHPNFNYILKNPEEDDASLKAICNDYMVENPTMIEKLNEYYKTNKDKFYPQNKSLEFEHEPTIPVYEFVGCAPIGLLKSQSSSFLQICTSLPPDLIMYSNDIRIYTAPLLMGSSILNASCYYITYRINMSLSKLLALKPYNKFMNRGTNALIFDRRTNNYVEDYKMRTMKGLNVNTSGHAHNCRQEMRKYTSNDDFIACFMNELTSVTNSKNIVLGDEIKIIEKEIEFYLTLGTAGKMVLDNYFTKILNKYEKEDRPEDINSIIADAINDVMSDTMKNEINLEDLGENQRDLYDVWQPGKNVYSPIPIDSNLYHNLKTVFGDKLEYLMNRNLSMTKKARSNALLELESKRLLYNSLYEKMAINSHDIKVYRLFIAWLKSLIIGCTTIDENAFLDNKINEIINKLNLEIFSEIGDPDRYLSDESEFDYI